jgi:hydrogenase maturation protein HypF
MSSITTVRFRVYGIVQGVGFRPTVDRHAQTAGIRGSVCNKGPYVEIFAQGTSAQIKSFETLLNEHPPRRAAILKIDEKPVEDAAVFESFSIIESEKTSGEIYISPDIAICEECEQEMYDPRNRRYLHPFINCTCCGPRMTILDALPYDRERTSMKMFPMCKPCAEEYYGPWSRRYDAQPVCCNDCGPQV